MTRNPPKQTILIVDDNPLNRELIIAAAESSDCSWEQAENGREALKKVQGRSYSLIFMDLLMPGMDGFETVRQIRARGILTPIIALSALSMKQDMERALDSGCNAFVAKPIDLENLKAIIADHLAHQAATSFSEPAITPAVGSPSFDFSPYRVILVEEDSERAAAHIRVLRRFGFTMQHAATGSQALDFLQAEYSSADIIVSNLYTSGIDAMGLLAMVRRLYPEVLVFIYTQKYDPDMYQLAMQQGADGIFPETILHGPALGMIESALVRRRQSAIPGRELAGQLRQAQAELIGFGCEPACISCDLDFKSLHDAGGDIVRCRKFNRTGRCGFVLADIAGHDLASLYMSAVFLGILTSCWDAYQNPSVLLRVINTEFIKLGYDKSHVCVSAMLWDAPRRTMHIATAGNPGVLLYERTAGGEFVCREIAGGGMCLGLLKEHDLISVSDVVCPAESYIFMFSDGFEKEAIQTVLASNPAMLQDGPQKGLCNRLLKYAGFQQQDDMVLLSYYMPPQEKPSWPCFDFKSTYEGVDRACEWAAKILTPDMVPSGKDVDFILLALRETMLNAVEHGNRRNPDAFVDIRVYAAQQFLTVEISDEGPGFDPAQALAVAATPESMLGKRGLSAVRAAADSFTVEGGTVILRFDGQ